MCHDKKVSVLFTREDSVYNDLGVDVWPQSRDARNWRGGNPIIAHPPCAQWGRLAAFAHKDIRQKALALWSVLLVRRFGGILEHPIGSRLFQWLPKPGERDEFGITTVVDQQWFGHRGQKRTYLYVCGYEGKLPGFPLELGRAKMAVQNMGTAEREKTPLAFAEWLIDVAKECVASPRSGVA